MDNIPRWFNGIAIYCEWLYEVNKKIIELTGLDCINDRIKMEKLFLEISSNIMKLVPCKTDMKNRKAEQTRKDGILDFTSELDFLQDDYDDLFNKYNRALYKIKIIRNKYEHIPHKLKMMNSSSGSTSYPNVTFTYDNGRKNIYIYDKDYNYDVKTEEFIEIVNLLNTTFNKIINELKKFRETNDEKYGDHPFLVKYTAINYEIFNRLFKCNLLSDIGKAMKSF